uniref:Aquaporin n=1 Tax=Romanomermis culicivorax TaxID=13658 RepID=A0A915HFH0_ROMCU
LIGNGSVAQSVLSSSKHGTFLSINIGFALAVGLGVYISGGVSGGHVNPAITLAMCLLGKTRWRQLPVYFAAQYLGCFFGALLVYMVYY